MSTPRPLQIAGSILAGDVLNLAGAIQIAERAGADLLQLDVCDGHFVPTISFGEEVVRRTCEVTKLPVEVHLMVSRPEDWLSRMRRMGPFRMIFHVEASLRSMGLVQAIAREGWEPGVALNPETPAGAIETLLHYVTNVCVMGIAPGFAGQKMLDTTFGKVADLRAMIRRAGSQTTITVDGGVKPDNAKKLVDAGADILVVSSAMYQHPSPESSLKEIRRLVAGG
jgi:ribulose-phosphate 3-epimerase